MFSGSWVEVDGRGAPQEPDKAAEWAWFPELLGRREDARSMLEAGQGSIRVGLGEGHGRRQWRVTAAQRRAGSVRLVATEEPQGAVLAAVPHAVEALQAAAGVGRVLLDLDGHVLWGDTAAETLLDAPAGGMLGQPFAERWVDEAARSSFQGDLRAAALGEEILSEFTCSPTDASRLEFDICVVPVRDEDRELVGLALSLRDVTVSRELVRLQNMDSAMHTVARVIADAAHGVNNLAARMLAVCERAARDDDPASFGTALTNMQSLAVQLGEVGREMLWVAAPGATAGPSDLGKLGQELGRFMRRVAGPEGPSVEVRAAEGILVVSAPDVFIRAASPFALRAIDLARKGRRSVHVDVLSVGGRGLLRLRYDAPVGELDLLRHVFQHGAAGGHSFVHGARDGLHITAVPTSSMQIAVEISSDVAQLAPPVSVSSLSGRSSPRGRLLIADDEIDLRDLYAEILSPSFSEVVKVGDGQAAWEWLEAMNGEFALVLLDLRMPRIDGMDVLKRARGRWPALRVVVVSGAAPDGVVQSAMAEGARHVLSKPFTIRELRAVVRVALAEPATI